MLNNPFPTGPAALALVQQHLPRVLAADGCRPADRRRARLLTGIARQQLRRHYGSSPAACAAQTVLRALARVETGLEYPVAARHWPFAQQQLGRIMPLVERLLAA